MATLSFLPGSLPTTPLAPRAATPCTEGQRHWLPAGRVKAFAGYAGKTTVRCLSGQAWLSVNGRDIVLGAGETFSCTDAGKVVAEGLADAMLCVAE